MINYEVFTCVRKEGEAEALLRSLVDNCLGKVLLQELVAQPNIGAGYNQAFQSTADVVIFTHSDVQVLAGLVLWNAMLEKCLQPETGFVGVAGCERLSPDLVWWQAANGLRGCVWHQDAGKIYASSFGPIGPVQVLDGVFLAIERKKLTSLGLWREDLGWHYYDIDMTMRASKRWQNEVVMLPLLHQSVGVIGDDWMASRAILATEGLLVNT